MIASVELHTGRWCLMIARMVIAVEADPCREFTLDGSVWTKHTLEQAAARINAALYGEP
jgi:hypothetical protein